MNIDYPFADQIVNKSFIFTEWILGVEANEFRLYLYEFPGIAISTTPAYYKEGGRETWQLLIC